MGLVLESQDFRPNKEIPKVFTGEGANISPELTWRNIPEGTKELALICEDPDAKTSEPFVHWIVYGIPPQLKELPKGISKLLHISEPLNLFQGKNSYEKIGYAGPFPPVRDGWHHYNFHLYAIDTNLNLIPGVEKKELVRRMTGHVLGQAKLIGKYRRESA